MVISVQRSCSIVEKTENCHSSSHSRQLNHFPIMKRRAYSHYWVKDGRKKTKQNVNKHSLPENYHLNSSTSFNFLGWGLCYARNEIPPAFLMFSSTQKNEEKITKNKWNPINYLLSSKITDNKSSDGTLSIDSLSSG